MTWTPAIFSRSQHEAVHAFYQQNGYIGWVCLYPRLPSPVSLCRIAAGCQRLRYCSRGQPFTLLQCFCSTCIAWVPAGLASLCQQRAEKQAWCPTAAIGKAKASEGSTAAIMCTGLACCLPLTQAPSSLTL